MRARDLLLSAADYDFVTTYTTTWITGWETYKVTSRLTTGEGGGSGAPGNPGTEGGGGGVVDGQYGNYEGSRQAALGRWRNDVSNGLLGASIAEKYYNATGITTFTGADYLRQFPNDLYTKVLYRENDYVPAYGRPWSEVAGINDMAAITGNYTNIALLEKIFIAVSLMDANVGAGMQTSHRVTSQFLHLECGLSTSAANGITWWMYYGSLGNISGYRAQVGDCYAFANAINSTAPYSELEARERAVFESVTFTYTPGTPPTPPAPTEPEEYLTYYTVFRWTYRQTSRTTSRTTKWYTDQVCGTSPGGKDKSKNLQWTEKRRSNNEYDPDSYNRTHSNEDRRYGSSHGLSKSTSRGNLRTYYVHNEPVK